MVSFVEQMLALPLKSWYKMVHVSIVVNIKEANKMVDNAEQINVMRVKS